jgi:cytochrome P460
MAVVRDARGSGLENFFFEGELIVSQLVTKSVVQEEPEQKRKTRNPGDRIAGFAIVATAGAVLAVLAAVALSAQGQNNDKYSLKSPGGIAFSDFRGYEDWSVASSARTDEVLKVIVANPTMVTAYKAGVPGNGQPFPDGSMVVKLQWKPKKSTEAPFVVDVPDVFAQAFVMEKDSKRFPKSGGWGYAVFNYDAASDKFAPDPKSLSDCGNACHTAVKAKDYIFHPYQKR